MELSSKALCLAVPVSAMAALAAIAPTADAASLSCRQAKAAVKRELKQARLDGSPTVSILSLSCQRLTSTRAKVRWRVWTRGDVSGNFAGHRGTATVRKYRYGTDVSLGADD